MLKDWKEYKDKITSGTLSLDDYTNRVYNQNVTMPGSYLCNFLERTTKETLGYSRPGNANQFGVKLNNDNKTYYIKRTEKSEEKSDATADEAKAYFEENIKGLLKSIVSESDPQKKAEIIDRANYSDKQILLKMAVLDNFYDFLLIYSDSSINLLYNELVNGDNNIGVCEKNYEICKRAKELLDIKVDDFKEQYFLSWFLWKYTKLNIANENSPNVILYGAPGTGKTFLAKQIAKQMIGVETDEELEKSGQFAFVQFHPSYDYTDFVEGLRPTKPDIKW